MAQKLTLSGNGDSAWHQIPSGKAVLIVSGTFGGGTVTLQVQQLDLTTGVPYKTFTAAGVQNLDCDAPVTVRWGVTGSTTPTIVASIVH